VPQGRIWRGKCNYQTPYNLCVLCGKIFTMTFQRSLYISLFIHVLVFGSAIAFAQFVRGALSGHWDMTVVSLVDPGLGTQGKASKSRASRNKEHREVTPDLRPEAIPETATSQAKTEVPAEKQAPREETSLQGGQENDKVGASGSGDAGALHGQAGEGSAGSGPDAKYGVVPAEQWAVIVSSIERVKRYPRFARERGIQGVVHLRFRVRPEGEVDRVEIVRSSGYEILDTASVRTVYRAAPMPYVNGWIEVPISYVLK
jgi:TonB family protein